MYCADGVYRCDRCGKVIEGTVPNVVDDEDYALMVIAPGLEGTELCDECYHYLIDGQEKFLSDFKASLQFNWRKDNEDTFADWLHDDITWCRRECPNRACERNNKNIRSHGLHSYADFYKEGKCPEEAYERT